MTRLVTTGYETGDVAEAGTSTIGGSTTHTVVASAPTPRGGSYCFKLTNPISATMPTSYKSFALGAAKTEVWARFVFFAHPVAGTGEVGIAGLLDAAAAFQASITWSATDGLLRLYRGAAGTILATSSSGFAAESWHVIEWRLQILTATTGVGEVWLDGTRVINFSGDVANTATLNVQALLLGHVGGVFSGAPNAYFGFDDIAVNDTAGTLNNGRVGDGRVVLLVPNGAGFSTMLARGGTDSGANWSQVDEVPASLADYVGSSTVADRDLYAMADLGFIVSSINVVEAVVLAQNSDAGGGSIAPTIKSGATINEATAVALGTTASYVTSRWETDPATTVAWTVAALNALEAGVTVR